MGKSTDVHPVAASVYFLPIRTRMPLKFGPEITTEVTCARIRVTVADARGRRAEGWGETPLSVQWVWPSTLGYEERHQVLRTLTATIAGSWIELPGEPGHPIELGDRFIEQELTDLLDEFNDEHRSGTEPVPWLAALVCASAFDLAVHDAYGILHGVPTYETYNARFMNADLGDYLESAEGADISFDGLYPEDFLVRPRPQTIPAWHLVGGKDPIDPSELTGGEPADGYPVLLRDWIRRDGLKCLKVKLRGDDDRWDHDRLTKIGAIAVEENVDWLTADFNCTVQDPAYVNAILDRLMSEHPRLYGMMLYVEQPFPYDLEQHRIDVHSVSARKPLFMDESAHDWRLIRLGRSLGWTGVALKTCKTQTGALLSLCWAKAHGMSLMVQDLTNPMLAQVPHVLLAAYAGTIMGVESNGMQFYPEASRAEAAVHLGLYRRRQGMLDLSSISGPGLGYRVSEVERVLPSSDFEVSA
jgi:L-alanine-DL-glutamate epimerase-like enolase superfamily enzyme